MRIVSLVPAATEMVVALGGEDLLVGISHQCDWPASVQHLPRVTTTPIETSHSSAAIDAQVHHLSVEGVPVIGVDPGLLQSLAPDLILAQDLCAVCAATDDGIQAVTDLLHPAPALLALKARTLEGVFSDIVTVGSAIGLADEAEELIAGLRYRLHRLAATGPAKRPRVVCVEWLDPIYLAGHWVPELIAAAGGEDVGAAPGGHSRTVSLGEIQAMAPEVILVAPCGFGLDRTESAYREFERAVSPGWPEQVWLLDGNAYTSRPGPRLVDGAFRIATALRGRAILGLRRWQG